MVEKGQELSNLNVKPFRDKLTQRHNERIQGKSPKYCTEIQILRFAMHHLARHPRRDLRLSPLTK